MIKDNTAKLLGNHANCDESVLVKGGERMESRKNGISTESVISSIMTSKTASLFVRVQPNHSHPRIRPPFSMVLQCQKATESKRKVPIGEKWAGEVYCLLRNQLGKQCASEMLLCTSILLPSTFKTDSSQSLYFHGYHGAFKEVLPECAVYIWGLPCGYNVPPCSSRGVDHRPCGEAK